MSESAESRRTLATASQVVVFAWAIGSGLYLGLFAHGGYVSTRQALDAVLVVLAAFAIFAVLRAQQQVSRPSRMLRVLAVSLVAILGARFLAFQTGLAIHQPPATVSDFFLAVP